MDNPGEFLIIGVPWVVILLDSIPKYEARDQTKKDEIAYACGVRDGKPWIAFFTDSDLAERFGNAIAPGKAGVARFNHPTLVVELLRKMRATGKTMVRMDPTFDSGGGVFIPIDKAIDEYVALVKKWESK